MIVSLIEKFECMAAKDKRCIGVLLPVERVINMLKSVHAQWVFGGYCAGLPFAYCSKCHGDALRDDGNALVYSKYCHHCGALMQQESKLEGKYD